MRRIRLFLGMAPSQRRALLEACFWLPVARLLILAVPFRRLSRWMGRWRSETGQGEAPTQQPGLREVFHAIRIAGRVLPGSYTCLTRAFAAQRMLVRRGLGSTLYLGLARDQASGELIAHAWLRSGSRILTGGPESERKYTVVGTFAAEGNHEDFGQIASAEASSACPQDVAPAEHSALDRRKAK